MFPNVDKQYSDNGELTRRKHTALKQLVFMANIISTYCGDTMLVVKRDKTQINRVFLLLLLFLLLLNATVLQQEVPMILTITTSCFITHINSYCIFHLYSLRHPEYGHVYDRNR